MKREREKEKDRRRGKKNESPLIDVSNTSSSILWLKKGSWRVRFSQSVFIFFQGFEIRWISSNRGLEPSVPFFSIRFFSFSVRDFSPPSSFNFTISSALDPLHLPHLFLPKKNKRNKEEIGSRDCWEEREKKEQMDREGMSQLQAINPKVTSHHKQVTF